MTEEIEQNQVKRKRIAILLPNPCNPDFRVIKQAETYAKAGHDVRIYCRGGTETPEVEKVNGVIYVRQAITADVFLKKYVERIIARFGFGSTSVKNRVSQHKNNIEAQINRLQTGC